MVQVFHVAFLSLMVGAIYTDVSRMKIPNGLVVTCIALFILKALCDEISLQDAALHFATAACVLSATLIPYSLRVLGAGDVKLLSSLGLWYGWQAAFIDFLGLLSALGLVLAIAILSLRRCHLPPWALTNKSIRRLRNPKRGLPYAVAIGIAAIATSSAIF